MTEFLETTIDKFLFRVATDRRYSPEGVWVRDERGQGSQGGRLRVGLSDYVQQRNGDVAFVHIKPLGTLLAAGEPLAEIETIKATFHCNSPVSGRLLEANDRLDSAPETVNDKPYGEGWLAVLEGGDSEAEMANLLDAEAYLAVMRRQAEEELAP